MGGHGGAKGNTNNMQETDEEMQGKVQLIDTIKHNPQHFHLEFFDAANMYQIVGGEKSLAFGAAGALISHTYWSGKASRNFYAFNINAF